MLHCSANAGNMKAGKVAPAKTSVCNSSNNYIGCLCRHLRAVKYS